MKMSVTREIFEKASYDQKLLMLFDAFTAHGEGCNARISNFEDETRHRLTTLEKQKMPNKTMALIISIIAGVITLLVNGV